MKVLMSLATAVAVFVSQGIRAQDARPARPNAQHPAADSPTGKPARPAPRATEGGPESTPQHPAPQGETGRNRAGASGKDEAEGKLREDRERLRTFLDEHPKIAADLRNRADVNNDGQLSPAEKVALLELVRAKVLDMRQDEGKDGRGRDAREGKDGKQGAPAKDAASATPGNGTDKKPVDPATTEKPARPTPRSRGQDPSPAGDPTTRR